MFKTIFKDNANNNIIVQGARSKNVSSNIATLLFQNFDDDVDTVFNMGSIGVRDHFGNSACNGYGDLVFETGMGEDVTNTGNGNENGNGNGNGGVKSRKAVNTLYERARLTYDGRLGIGTTTPQHPLHVEGTAQCTHIETASLSVTDSVILQSLTVNHGTHLQGDVLVGGTFVAPIAASNVYGVLDVIHGGTGTDGSGLSSGHLLIGHGSQSITTASGLIWNEDLHSMNITGHLVTHDATIGGLLNALSNLVVSKDASVLGTLNANRMNLCNLTVTQSVDVGGAMSITGALHTLSNLVVNKDASVGGSLGVSSDTTLSGVLNVARTLTAMSNVSAQSLSVTNDLSVQGALTVIGAMNLTNLNVPGVITTSNLAAGGLNVLTNMVVSKDASVVGTLTASNLNLCNLAVSKDTSVGGVLNVTGTLNALSNLVVSKDASIGGVLSVTGALNALSNLVVSKDASVGGVLSVTGALNTLSNLVVSKDASIGGVLSVTGALNALSNLVVSKDASVGGLLSVTGALNALNNTTIGGVLNVTAALNALSNLVVNKDATVLGTLNANILGASNLTVAQTASVGGALTVTGTLNALSNLVVSKDVTVLGNLTVNGTQIFNATDTLLQNIQLPYVTAPTGGVASKNIIYSDATDGYMKMLLPSNSVFTLGPYFANQHGYVFIENTTPVSATSTTNVTRFTYTTGVLEPGSYRLAMFYDVSSTTNGRVCCVNIFIDGTIWHNEILYMNNKGTNGVAYDFEVFTFTTASTHNILVKHSSGGNYLTTVNRVALELFRIS